MVKPAKKWHRLFGLFLCDFFEGTPFEVELEKDLTKRAQRLDVAVLRKRPGVLIKVLPDGFGDLGPHNLISFKSYRGTLDAWAINELIGYYVAYRKQVNPRRQPMPAEGDFRLYAVSVRYPKALAAQVELRELSAGVYEIDLKTIRIRVVVVERLPESDPNAMLLLFSGNDERVQAARQRFKMQSAGTSSLVADLLGQYEVEGEIMAYTMDDFKREFRQKMKKELKAEMKEEMMAEMTLEELSAAFPPERLLRSIPAEDRMRGLSAEEIRKAMDNLGISQQN